MLMPHHRQDAVCGMQWACWAKLAWQYDSMKPRISDQSCQCLLHVPYAFLCQDWRLLFQAFQQHIPHFLTTNLFGPIGVQICCPVALVQSRTDSIFQVLCYLQDCKRVVTFQSWGRCGSCDQNCIVQRKPLVPFTSSVKSHQHSRPWQPRHERGKGSSHAHQYCWQPRARTSISPGAC